MILNNCKLILAEPRGFCAGVDRAIEIVNQAIKTFNEAIYVKHEVVHNKNVINDFIERGVRFVESLDEVPNGAILIFSAHGVSKDLTEKAKEKGLRVFDATCPLVTKIHFQIHKYANANIDVILIGHSGHPEVEGTMGQYISDKGKIMLIEKEEDIDKLLIKNSKVAYVTQTTLSVDDTQNIIKKLKIKFPHITGPRKNDICYATQNRQEAVRNILHLCDCLIVVGSQNSSNSQRLKEIAEKHGIKGYLIDDQSQININELVKKNVIGITAGASAPEHTVQELVRFLTANGASLSEEKIVHKKENVVFSLPKNLR